MDVLGVREEKTVVTPKKEKNGGHFGCERRKNCCYTQKRAK